MQIPRELCASPRSFCVSQHLPSRTWSVHLSDIDRRAHLSLCSLLFPQCNSDELGGLRTPDVELLRDGLLTLCFHAEAACPIRDELEALGLSC
ncbi:unnamed protein product [Heligmosomoides polygyrus]|uniref:Magnesium transporter n=1 Tax=Heligmosomoides polygyrus TaxID=6339 RepID=A0A183FP12_HELPZ|nr:unnamed protein product [Heligmosomoides polygyrus]